MSEPEFREHVTSGQGCWCQPTTTELSEVTTNERLRNSLRRERAFARQAREGERLRVEVRNLIDNASAGLIHYSGESCDVVRVSDLRRAMDVTQ